MNKRAAPRRETGTRQIEWNEPNYNAKSKANGRGQTEPINRAGKRKDIKRREAGLRR